MLGNLMYQHLSFVAHYQPSFGNVLHCYTLQVCWQDHNQCPMLLFQPDSSDLVHYQWDTLRGCLRHPERMEHKMSF